jgi:hypothetical protein
MSSFIKPVSKKKETHNQSTSMPQFKLHGNVRVPGTVLFEPLLFLTGSPHVRLHLFWSQKTSHGES